jgi:peptidoglycan/LPS O-acetylase OafA/YrhL
MEKLANLQIMRAVAAILVVWTHAIDVVGTRHRDAFQIAWGALENFGAVGADLFFVISGFIVSLTAERSSGVRPFLEARVVRIWPLYAIATLLVVAIDPSARDWTKLTCSLLFLQVPGDRAAMPTHPLGWSLMFEAVFYGMLAVAMGWKGARPVPERVLVLAAVAVLGGVVHGVRQPMNIVGNPILVEFMLGVVLGWVYRRRPALPRLATSSLFIAGSVLLLSTAIYGFGEVGEATRTLDGTASWDRVRLWGVPSALLIASAVFRTNTVPRWCRPVVFLGDGAYAIYLFSFIALLLLDRGWERWAPESGDTAIVLATAVAVGVGVIGHVLVERPLTAPLRAVLRARGAAAGGAG